MHIHIYAHTYMYIISINYLYLSIFYAYECMHINQQIEMAHWLAHIIRVVSPTKNPGGMSLPGTGEVPPGGMAMENLWLWGDRKLGTQWAVFSRKKHGDFGG